jgi:hypothetical protein
MHPLHASTLSRLVEAQCKATTRNATTTIKQVRTLSSANNVDKKSSKNNANANDDKKAN